MRFHKSSTSTDIINRGASKVAMMVASEFWRARDGSAYRDEAVRALWRARELMGVLEIMDLPASVSQKLLPYYNECSLKTMFKEEQLSPNAIQEFSSRLAEVFDQTAHDLAPWEPLKDH